MKQLIVMGCVCCACGLASKSGAMGNPPRSEIFLPDGREVKPLEIRVKEEILVEGIRVLELEFPYIGSDGQQHSGERMRLYLPPAKRPPLLVSVHYEMSLEDVETNIGIKTYIEKGWAVLTPVELSSGGLQNVFAANLEFSVASTHAAFGMEWIDPQRICVAGGSAGGYQTLVVAACTPNIVAAVVWSPITSPIYQTEYFRKNQMVKNPESVSEWWDTFGPSCEWLAGRGLDSPENRAISPTFIVDRITCPILLTHSTADLVVPYCQVSKEPEASAVGGFSPEYVHSLEDVLSSFPALQRTFFDGISTNSVERFTLRPAEHSKNEEGIVILDLPFGKEKRFSFVTFDEGPVNAATQGHFLNAFRCDCTQFLEFHLKSTEDKKTEPVRSETAKTGSPVSEKKGG